MCAVQPAVAARPAESGPFWFVYGFPTLFRSSMLFAGRLNGQPFGGDIQSSLALMLCDTVMLIYDLTMMLYCQMRVNTHFPKQFDLEVKWKLINSLMTKPHIFVIL